MSHPKTYTLISAFFGLDIPAGGLLFSADIVREWLHRGHRVHIFCSSLDQYYLGDLVEFERSGSLQLHGIMPKGALEFGHQLSQPIYDRARVLLNQIKPDRIHVHNFHGMLSAIGAAVDSKIPTIFTPLDFGLACLTWFFFDGTTQPCSGPERSKCQACVLRSMRLHWSDFPYHIAGIAKRLFGSGTDHGHRRYFDFRLQRYWRTAPENIEFMLSLFPKFSQIIAPSPPVQKMAARFRNTESNIHSLLYPVSPHKIFKSAQIKPVFFADKPVRLLFLSHGHPIKGWPFFLKVLESLEDGLSLEVWDIGGNTSLFRRASSRAKRYWRRSFRAPSDQIPQEITNADATLVPSLWHENTPLVVIETLANSRPVIASDQAGIRHLIQSGENGFLYRPADLAQWTEGLTRLARAPHTLRDMHKNCYYRKTVSDYVNDLELIENSI